MLKIAQFAIRTEIAGLKDLIESELEKYLPHAEDQSQIHAAIHHSILGGGHRYRPILLLMIADAYNVPRKVSLPMAYVVEMIHTAAIILDDLPGFDNAEIRHGEPSCHRQFGEYITILASHRLLCLCLEIIVTLRERFDAKGSCKIEHEYTKLINRMIRGEAMDIATRHQQIDVIQLTDIYANKSAELFAFAAASGAHLGRAAFEEIEALRRYGLNLGIAYQILDDIYDIEGGPGNVGKATNMDSRNGKETTFPLLYGVRESRKRLDAYRQKAVMQISSYPHLSFLNQLSEMIAPPEWEHSEAR